MISCSVPLFCFVSEIASYWPDIANFAQSFLKLLCWFPSIFHWISSI